MGASVVIADQIMRSEPLFAEWWIDIPVAGLIAALVLAALAAHRPRPIPGRSSFDSLDEVVLAVSRGRHVDEVLESLSRQACRIMRVERAVVVLRDESDPRSAMVVAGHGVPRNYVGSRIGIDEGMAGRVITTGEPVLVDDYAEFPGRIGHAAGEGLRAGAAVPIHRDGVVQGALAAGTTHPGRRFGARRAGGAAAAGRAGRRGARAGPDARGARASGRGGG